MTIDGLPMRPRGPARDAVNAAVASSMSGAAVPTPAVPEPTPAARLRGRDTARAAAPTMRVTHGSGAEWIRASRPATVATSLARPDTVLPSRRDLRPAGPAPTVLPSRRVLRPAGPAPTVLPSRRDLRPVRPAPAALALRTARQALTIPLRSISSAIGTPRTVPITATAVAACLFVTVASPQSAMAAPPEDRAMAVMDTQEYVAPDGVALSVDRDGFSIARAPQAARGLVGAAGVPAPGVSAVRPVAGTIPAAGGFGGRWVQGCTACSTNHQGLDFAAPTGTTVVAAMPGTVVSAGVFGGYGNQILLQHADGTQTRYGHLSQIGVRVGQVVAAGERIGAVGSTGVSTGSHLHFEVIVGGVPRDPAAWLGARGLL
ncbi:peptidoglycan DD-metalloendopeptidase family protein [Curtobacterium sp. NPDC090217]|uniref:M23 family metallopeptidase n=1 Tax=Curtobacterium sp. NPDC090217 TaxID=3363970 RepID=UPI0037F8F0B4